MKQKKLSLINTWLLLPLAICFSIGAYWRWFLLDRLTSGDWGYYYPETAISFFQNPTIWISNTNLGQIDLSASTHWFRYFFGYIASLGYDSVIASKVLFMWPIVLLSILGGYILVHHTTKNHISAFIGSLVYAFNTYVLIMATGHLTLLMAFCLFPLILYFYMRTLSEQRISLAIVSGLLSYIASVYEFRGFYLMSIVFGLYLIYHFIYRFKKPKSYQGYLMYIVVSVLPLVIVGVLHWYWIMAFAFSDVLLSNDVFNRGLFGNEFLSISSAITLFHPFWTGGKTAVFEVQPIPWYYFSIPIAVLIGVLKNRRNHHVLFFSIIALIGIFLTKQVDLPFSGAFPFFRKAIPGFSAFREASKFYIMIALSYAVLIGFFVKWFVEKAEFSFNYSKLVKPVVLVGISCIFLLNTIPLVTGEIDSIFVERDIHPDYLKFRELINADQEFGRIIAFPKPTRFIAYNELHPLIFMSSFNGWAEYFNTDTGLGTYLEQLENQEITNNLFDYSSIKYIVLPVEDGVFNPYDDHGVSQEYYEELLDENADLKRLEGFDEMVVYENREYEHQVLLTKYPLSATQDQISIPIKFSKVSPTEIEFTVEKIYRPSVLSFSNEYHPGWGMTFNERSDWQAIFSTKSYFIPSLYHQHSAIGTNSFILDPDYLRTLSNGESIIENEDGSLTLNGRIFFQPQSWFSIGYPISLALLILTLIVGICFLVYEKLSKN